MKKLGLLFKQTSENQIKDNFKNSGSIFIVKYSGLASPDLSSLRTSLKAANAQLFMVKNSVARRALKGAGLDDLLKLVDGPCGLVFIKDEPVSASRALYEFSRAHQALKLEGGYLKDRILDTKNIEDLARLPSREVLRAKAVMVLNFPIRGLAVVLNQALRKFVYCLDQVKEKKSSSK